MEELSTLGRLSAQRSFPRGLNNGLAVMAPGRNMDGQDGQDGRTVNTWTFVRPTVLPPRAWHPPFGRGKLTTAPLVLNCVS